MGKPRHAIVLVHGQGEQRPMEMGPQFVEHVFMADFDPATASAAANPQVRWVAEDQPAIDEQRRIEVRFADNRPDFDVFELYWAPLMGDSRSSHFLMWFFGLLRRPRSDIPKRVRYLHTLTIVLIWAMLLFAAFYLYTTFSSLMPVQIVQIAANDYRDILEFSFDWRLAAVLSGLMLFVAATVSIVLRNYGWCVSFLVPCIAICLVSPLVIGSSTEIENDVDWIKLQRDEAGFNIWGLKLTNGKATAGPISSAAANVSRYLCSAFEPADEDDEPRKPAGSLLPDDIKGSVPETAIKPEAEIDLGPETDAASGGNGMIGDDLPRPPETPDEAKRRAEDDAREKRADEAGMKAVAAVQAAVDKLPPDEVEEEPEPASVDLDDALEARRDVNLSTNRPLTWDDMKPNRGAQLKDICLAPVAVTNPVLFARVADSAHILLSTMIIVFAVFFYCIWRAFLQVFIVDIMGDSARYLNSHPKNNIARHNIRQSGLTLLRALHKSGRYDRIFIFAHSLGSIVAYDALRQYWGHVASEGVAADASAVTNARAKAKALDEAEAPVEAVDDWQAAQDRIFASLSRKWPISDFVTLGSPLSHGRLLLETSSDSVHASGRFVSQRDVTRSILACPPVDRETPSTSLSPSEMFLVVRWTNLFFDNDVVGGTVAVDSDGLLFGRGVKDLKFKPGEQAAPGISHNSYWLSRLKPTESGAVPWLNEIRRILGVDLPHDGAPEA
ncbi:hypothetical protein [Sphingopyxis sp. JAI128]|uniref:hypothetical protein n=1 Tax=Sphingopyxis sp. JAI128 TaxID=2723066 RepID=UPI00161FAF95|nr:hypothetical protein [Sphingopyxis sp. JAI128]MBB6428053.1 hypothetical protein [Sphingopyxis sp. JAI128]